MKKVMMAVLFAAGCLAANAEGDWRETCGKIVCLGGDTGLAGFVKRMAPDYMTGDFAEADRPERKPFSANRNGYYDKDLAWHGGYFNDVGAFVEGHEVLTLFGMPYGLGQFIMIPVCLILMYLAIVKGFEPLLLLPIGFGGRLGCSDGRPCLEQGRTRGRSDELRPHAGDGPERLGRDRVRRRRGHPLHALPLISRKQEKEGS